MQTNRRRTTFESQITAARSRGRPTAEAAEKLTQDVLDAAEALFLRQGYTVSLQAVAQAAHVSRTALYARFATKEALLAGVVARLVEHWAKQTWIEGGGAGAPIDQRLHGLVSRTLAVMTTPKARQLERLARSRATRSPALLALIEDLGIERGVTTFAAAIADGSDGASPAQARRAALALIQMMVGWIATTDPRTARAKAPQDAAARTFVDILIQGRAAW